MSDVFLSYASEDYERVMPLVRALEATGLSVFWDRTIPTGKTWRQVIANEIRTARSIVVVWSKKSVTSDWVQEEAEEGKRRHTLFPVLIDKVLPPFGFGSLQAADLVRWEGSSNSRAFRQLKRDLYHVLCTSPVKEKEYLSKTIQEYGRRKEFHSKKQQGTIRPKLNEGARKKITDARRQTAETANVLGAEGKVSRRQQEDVTRDSFDEEHRYMEDETRGKDSFSNFLSKVSTRWGLHNFLSSITISMRFPSIRAAVNLIMPNLRPLCLILLTLTSITTIALLSYHHTDPSIHNAGYYGPVQNTMGVLGAHLAGLLIGLFGIASFWIPILLLLFCVRYMGARPKRNFFAVFTGSLLIIIFTAVLLAFKQDHYELFGSRISSGGIIGIPLKSFLAHYTNPAGGFLIALSLFIIGLRLLVYVNPLKLTKKVSAPA